MPAALEALMRAQHDIFAAGDIAGAFSAMAGGLTTAYQSLTPEERDRLGRSMARVNHCQLKCESSLGDVDVCYNRCIYGND
jgi:hypothetical protein